MRSDARLFFFLLADALPKFCPPQLLAKNRDLAASWGGVAFKPVARLSMATKRPSPPYGATRPPPIATARLTSSVRLVTLLRTALCAMCLLSTASASQLTLRWADNSDNESGFKIERSLLGLLGDLLFIEIATVGPDVTSYTDTTLLPSRWYSYRVRAYNEHGSSAYSNIASAVTPGASVTNSLPSVSPLPSQVLGAGQSLSVPFSIADAETAADELVLTIVSSDPNLGTPDQLVLSGSGETRTLTVNPRPGVSGTATITIVVDDGQASSIQSFEVTVQSEPVISNPTVPLPSGDEPGARLVNTSIRAYSPGGSAPLIAGFVVGGGTSERWVLVRGVGPSLETFGIAEPLADPAITFLRHVSATDIRTFAQNNDWSVGQDAGQLAAASALVEAFPLPAGSRDSALLVRLPAGAYSSHLQSVNGSPGTVLVELYDADVDSGAGTAEALSNFSMRGWASNGERMIIGGFSVAGSGWKRLLIRAVGPELARYDVPGVLSDPMLRLFRRENATESLVAINDDWAAGAYGAAIAATASEIGAFELDANSRSAALLVSLPAGVYTVQGGSKDGSAGEMLLEVYELP